MTGERKEGRGVEWCGAHGVGFYGLDTGEFGNLGFLWP
jgi:hypothetical protein